VGRDHLIRFWGASTGAPLFSLDGEQPWLTGLDISADGRRLAVSGIKGITLIFDLPTRRLWRRLTGHGAWVNAAKFLEGDRLLITAGDDKTVRLWSVATGEPLLVLPFSNGIQGVGGLGGRRFAAGDGTQLRLLPIDLQTLEHDPRRQLEDAQRQAGLRLSGFGLLPRLTRGDRPTPTLPATGRGN
jgi:WD40 repeat protein